MYMGNLSGCDIGRLGSRRVRNKKARCLALRKGPKKHLDDGLSQDGGRDLLALEQLGLEAVWTESLSVALDDFRSSRCATAELRSE